MAKKEETIIEELANAPREGENAFGEPGKETPVVSPTTETKEVVAEAPKVEENVPFHKHPRWIERERKQKEQIESLKSDFQKELEGIKKLIPAQAQPALPMPQWFVNIYGDNPEAWKEHSSYDAERRNEIKDELRKEFQAESTKSTQDIKEIEKSLDSSFAELKDSGRDVDENAFTKLILDFEAKGAKLPSKADNSFDFEAIYDLFDSMNILPKKQVSQTTSAKKELAAATIKRTPDASKREYSTPKDFKGKSFQSLLKP